MLFLSLFDDDVGIIVPERFDSNLFFLRAEKTRQRSFKREKNLSLSNFFLPQSLFFAFSSSNNRATKQVLRKDKKRRKASKKITVKRTRKEKFKNGQTLNSSKVKKRKKKKKTKLPFSKELWERKKSLSSSLQNTHEEETHTLKTHAHALLLRKEGDDERRV